MNFLMIIFALTGTALLRGNRCALGLSGSVNFTPSGYIDHSDSQFVELVQR
jgi:hypothetical protein